MFHKIQRIHLVGVGGSGMSGIAEVLQALGFDVSGSDARESAVTQRLAGLGIHVRYGHKPEHVTGASVVVYSSAVKPSNVELVAAADAHIPVIPRAEMLGELTRMKFTIGVAGTHGKTTTTSLIGQILTGAGLQPTIIVGGVARSLGSGGILGQGRHLVVEADEYARTFLSMYPTIGLVTSLEAEHLDVYANLDDLRDTFAAYLARLPFFGVAVLCVDDPNVRALLPGVHRQVVTYGLSDRASVRAVDVRCGGFTSVFRLEIDGADVGTVELPTPGRHNIANALGAIAVAMELEVPFAEIRSAIATFSGVNRRFEQRGTVDGVTIVDDYAHHPTALRATLETARECGHTGRVIVVFQPHLFSRTRDFCEGFADALAITDIAFVTDIFPSREAPLPGISSDIIVDCARKRGHTHIVAAGNLTEAATAARDAMREGDIVVTAGAGDVALVGTMLLDGRGAGG